MCCGAGNAASAFGAALQVDSARTGATEKLQHPAARGGHDTDGGDRPEAVQSAEAGGEEDTEAADSKGGSAGSTESSGGGGVASADSMRAELLALQLIECANEMEDHLRVQVPSKFNVSHGLRKLLCRFLVVDRHGKTCCCWDLREQVGFSPTA